MRKRTSQSLALITFAMSGVALGIESGDSSRETVTISPDGASVEVRADALPELADRLIDPRWVTTLAVRPHARVRPDLRILDKLLRLRTLSLVGVAIDDDDLPLIVALPALESLDLSGTPISDKAVADHLWKCTRLKELSIRSSRLSSASLPFIGKLHELRRLALGGLKIRRPGAVVMPGDESFADIASLDKLEVLDLSGAIVWDADLPEFVKLDSLRELQLDWQTPTVTVEGLYGLKAESPQVSIASEVLRRLGGPGVVSNAEGEAIEVKNCLVRDLEKLGSVEDLSFVRSLWIYQLPTAKLAACMPNVRRLAIQGGKLTSEHASVLAGWKSLKEVRLDTCAVNWTEEDLEALRRIRFERVNVTDE